MEQGLSGAAFAENCRSGMQLVFQLDPPKASMFRVDSLNLTEIEFFFKNVTKFIWIVFYVTIVLF